MSADCPLCRSPLPPVEGLHEIQLMEIAQFIGQGQKIGAIKKVREITHAGLKEAKEYVDCPHRPIQREPAAPVSLLSLRCPSCDRSLPALSGATDAHLQSIAGHLVAGQKIEAIKAVRAASGLGLKEAKDYVDCPHDASKPLPKGCLGLFLFFF